MSAPVFVADAATLAGASVPGDRVVLDGPEGHHAATVRRLRPGEQVVLTDGRGGSARCTVDEVSATAVVCRVEELVTTPAPSPRLVVVQALPKGDRAELAVQMLTEVGADVIVPWAAARCVVRWRGDRADRSLRRWRAHAREAGKQARRAWLPEVTDLAGTAAVADRLRGCALPLVLHEGADRPPAGLEVPAVGDVVVVVGPEGGLTDDELARFADAGGTALRLGPTVLRTSTAGVAASAALLSRTGRWA